mmetsp:Transcript_9347/g.38328  ORF Transcript_9347/g.38328 Transcript_9347/m.38328 type:complete len:265 (+) Transcript_9347:329-1123(+)
MARVPALRRAGVAGVHRVRRPGQLPGRHPVGRRNGLRHAVGRAMDEPAVHLRAGALRAARPVHAQDPEPGHGRRVPAHLARDFLGGGRIHGHNHRPARSHWHWLRAQAAGWLGHVGGRDALRGDHHALPHDAALGHARNGGHRAGICGCDERAAARRVGAGGCRWHGVRAWHHRARHTPRRHVRGCGRARRRRDASQPLPAHRCCAVAQGAAHALAHQARRLPGQRGACFPHSGDHCHQLLHHVARRRADIWPGGPRHGRASGR